MQNVGSFVWGEVVFGQPGRGLGKAANANVHSRFGCLAGTRQGLEASVNVEAAAS